MINMYSNVPIKFTLDLPNFNDDEISFSILFNFTITYKTLYNVQNSNNSVLTIGIIHSKLGTRFFPGFDFCVFLT